MGRIRKKYTAQFKAKVAFEAAKGDRNTTEIAFWGKGEYTKNCVFLDKNSLKIS